MKVDKPLRNLTPDQLRQFIGRPVKKVSNKPFSSGQFTEIITGITTNPHTNQPAFTLKHSKYCEARQCVVEEQV